ncbi:MAG: arylsulfatase [Planctomycetes bacterium]|nr:arylsulfatase [Planctomycetota bacterium]
MVLLSALVFAVAGGVLAQEAKRKPNFVLIFCDDLGYGDVGCFGSTKHRTPHIDGLAKQGIRFTSCYSTSGVCTPSRSSLMTGCFPRRVNMHQSASGEWVLFPVARKGLNPAELTIAEHLLPHGYATMCVGKWHLGDQPPFLPTRQGFQQYFGIPYSNDMGARQRKKNPPLPLMRNETVIEAPADQTTLTKRYTQEAIRFITANRDRPFFLYLPHTFPHVPLFASDAFRGKSANGKYGDAVEEIDASTGSILKTLADLGLEKNTVVVFLSDNGAAARRGGSNAPLRGHKGSTWEGGMRIPCIVRWPGVIDPGSTSDRIASTMDVLPTFLHAAGGQLPEDLVIDGKDLRLGTKNVPGHDAFFYYFKDQLQAVRSGPWKLHLPRKERKKELPARLFHLDGDIAESKNVADGHADVVARLTELAEQAREDLGDRGRRGARQRPAGIMEDPGPIVAPGK